MADLFNVLQFIEDCPCFIILLQSYKGLYTVHQLEGILISIQY
jgi:hypothetical protein